MASKVESTPQALAGLLGKKDASIHLFVMAFDSSDNILLSKGPINGSRPSILHLPDASLPPNDSIATTSGLTQLTEIIISDELKNEAAISEITVLWSKDSPSNDAEINIVTGCRIQTMSKRATDYFIQNSAHYAKLDYHFLDSTASKSIALKIRKWKQSFTSLTSLRPPHQERKDSKTLIIVIIRNEPDNRSTRRFEKKRQGFESSRDRVEDLSWMPSERFALPAKKVAGQRFAHKRFRKGKKQVGEIRNKDREILEEAFAGFKALGKGKVEKEEMPVPVCGREGGER